MTLPVLPPLPALRAFWMFSETRSVAAAGAALNVSHAAISQQLRKLEADMGLALLDRSGRQMTLTAEGEQLARALSEGFGRIGQTVALLTGLDASRPLHIACTPSFAATWLMPRLAQFRDIAPDVELMVNPNPKLTDPTPGGVDVALRYGTGPWPGLDHEVLMPAPLVIVGAPQLFDGPLPTESDAFLAYPWLQEVGNDETEYWERELGVSGKPFKGVTHVPGNLMIDGARAGHGLALTTRVAVQDDLDSGRLLLLRQSARAAAYNIVTAKGVMRPPLHAFVRWLRKAARK